MIQGINCDVSYDEMRDLLAMRIAHHLAKESTYRKHVADLEASGLTPGQGSHDTLRELKDKVGNHERQAAVLAFIRDHLVAGETYRLSEVDMGRLGFVPRAYFP